MVFKEDAKKALTQQTKKENVLNLPYSESDSKSNKEEVPADQNIEFSMEQAPETERFRGYEEGETSSKRKSRKS